MSDCCETKVAELESLREQQSRVLVIVLAVNAVMFVGEFVAGWLAGSTALLADSLDMLGDAFVYGFSLYVLGRSAAWRARAALLKGTVMAAFGAWVLLEAFASLHAGAVPLAPAMFAVGFLALTANSFCFWLLHRHRHDDLNLRSTWLCSRNDLIANGAVLLAAGLVGWSHSAWPDLLVGFGIAALFLRTALGVIRDAIRELRAPLVANRA
ncbi:MAG: cation transporter [Myxococcales bacterium]|nr:cation transporter [Myxococcales bacterium]